MINITVNWTRIPNNVQNWKKPFSGNFKKLRIVLNEMSFYCTIKQWALIWNMFCWNYFKVSHLFDKIFPQTVIYLLLLYSGTKKYPSVAIDNG